MSRRAANFVQADVSRALRAAKAAGDGWRVDILPGGVISIVPVRITPPAHQSSPDTTDDDGSTIVL
ncbi:hypothetical protein C3941_13650 [Kaistia algarum]|uniref:hypothetical protein n=1 Tax=Kaistia algarum TaxID=2083279 RepID=UPI000CE7BAB9|nr:hypothetical protein [Kaistia algarum]MCX5513740.1 hypothetical protein [Kaistia algarum]PPE79389.1 hypothetical protein C3941_13650 [Kaistia algarum]